MKNKQNQTPLVDRNFYEFLRQLIQQNRGSADNTRIIVLGILIGFFAFVLTTLVFVKMTTSLSQVEGTSITNSQSNLPATK